ncbi:MAG: hypothetical protein QXF56_05140 [Candidatus Micrarchaeia archaeon]
MTDYIEAIICIIVLLISMSILSAIINSLSNLSCEQQIKPYLLAIQQKDAEIADLENRLNQAETKLQNLSLDYDRLIKENITKKDVEDIKNSFNITQMEINYINQKIDLVNNKFISVYNQLILFFNISLFLNIFLTLAIFGDFLAVNIFKFDIKKKIFELMYSKIKPFFKKFIEKKIPKG